MRGSRACQPVAGGSCFPGAGHTGAKGRLSKHREGKLEVGGDVYMHVVLVVVVAVSHRHRGCRCCCRCSSTATAARPACSPTVAARGGWNPCQLKQGWWAAQTIGLAPPPHHLTRTTALHKLLLGCGALVCSAVGRRAGVPSCAQGARRGPSLPVCVAWQGCRVGHRAVRDDRPCPDRGAQQGGPPNHRFACSG